MTVAGLNIGTLISSAVLIEQIFDIPGMGLEMVKAVLGREYVAAQSLICVVAVVFVVVNFMVDVLYTVLDPRIRYA
ncbi:MAG: ABC transporter permease subunit [Microthrixaceae bacterium]